MIKLVHFVEGYGCLSACNVHNQDSTKSRLSDWCVLGERTLQFMFIRKSLMNFWTANQSYMLQLTIDTCILFRFPDIWGQLVKCSQTHGREMIAASMWLVVQLWLQRLFYDLEMEVKNQNPCYVFDIRNMLHWNIVRKFMHLF